MNVFEYSDFRKFVRDTLSNYPKKGHGQYLKLAKLLGVHTTMVTHIFKNNAHLSVEHALKITGYFGLSELETEYFVVLVQLDRASTVQSREYFKKQLATLETRSKNIGERLQEKQTLDESDQAIFYSNWYYSGIRLLTATQKIRGGAAQLSEELGLPAKTVSRVLEFLISKGLLRTESDGSLGIGETSTFVSRDSPLVSRHHLNWRLKAVSQLDSIPDEELVFTNPITVSEKDFQVVREEIIRLIEKFKNICDPSEPERLCFLNIDWRKLQTK